jgi:hypothetical protein
MVRASNETAPRSCGSRGPVPGRFPVGRAAYRTDERAGRAPILKEPQSASTASCRARTSDFCFSIGSGSCAGGWPLVPGDHRGGTKKAPPTPCRSVVPLIHNAMPAHGEQKRPPESDPEKVPEVQHTYPKYPKFGGADGEGRRGRSGRSRKAPLGAPRGLEFRRRARERTERHASGRMDRPRRGSGPLPTRTRGPGR